jgi:hypothetical protein
MDENHYLKEKLAQLCAELKSFQEREAATTQRQFEIEELLRTELALSHEREAATVELLIECASVRDICAAQRTAALHELGEWEVFWDLERSEEEIDVVDDG